MKRSLFVLGLTILLASGSLEARWFMQPEISLETRFFPEDPQFSEQHREFQPSMILSGEARWTRRDRRARFQFEPYLRLDGQDNERSYFDLRELSYSQRFGDWDVLVGASQVFWGVAESRNIVDVMNQFDTIEDFDEGEKLGQPMARVSYRNDLGRWEFYYLPYFRERLFPGEDGRLRTPIVVDTGATQFTRENEEWAGDFALRYTQRFGEFDLGLHVFYGTNRSPLLALDPNRNRFIPIYQELTQAGLDLQYTKDAWLLKLEAVAAEIEDDSFAAVVTGFEYTFFDLGGLGHDLGVIGEYLYDGRDPTVSAATLFADDLFAGLRYTLNDAQDTEFLGGAIIDLETEAMIASIEFQRRLGSDMLLEIEARYFDEGKDTLVSSLSDDSHLLLRLTRYF